MPDATQQPPRAETGRRAADAPQTPETAEAPGTSGELAACDPMGAADALGAMVLPVGGQVKGVQVARGAGGGPVRRTVKGLLGLFTAGFRSLHRASRARGAGETGLSRLIGLHLVNNAGDALITLALATTVFFSVPTGQARPRVALYLAVTMAPFALMAPVIGPLLDRLRRGRRLAMTATMLARVSLAFVMAGSIEDAGLSIYPAAFGVLVASKAYGVSRSAVVPRLQPRSVSLVKTNSRITMFGLIGTMAAAPVAGLLKITGGTAWILYAAIAVFLCGAVLSLRLPSRVDSAQGEDRAAFTSAVPGTEAPRLALEKLRGGHDGADRPPSRREARRARRAAKRSTGDLDQLDQATEQHAEQVRRAVRPSRRLRSVGPSVVHALWANAAFRAFSGFLIFFLGFLLRTHPIGGLKPNTALAVVAGAAAVGNALGTLLGAWLKSRAPEAIVVGVLVVTLASATTAAVHYSVWTVVGVAAVAGLAQALGKLSLDAMIQRDIPEEVRTSAFARTETALQLAWVAGGAVGILLPLNGTLGMSVAAVVLLAALVLAGRRLATRRRARKRSPGMRVRGAR